MPTATLTCPHCTQTLKVSTGFQAGSRFRCPACNSAFAARPQDVPASRTAPRRRSIENAPPPSSGGWLMLLGVVGVAVLLLLGAAAALALHFLPTRTPPHAALKPAADQPTAGEPQTDDPLAFPDQKEPHKRRPRPVDWPPDAPPELAPEPPAQAWLPPEQQEKVNAAIERGVAYLKKMQTGGGTWGFDHQTGLAALPALTLLECGVPTDDSHIQKAAGLVRRTGPGLNGTYELALAILFLDRLGDAQDEPLIRSLALRLLAGQSPAGGWTYNCPVLSEKDERSLWTILDTTRPRSSLDLIAPTAGDNRSNDIFTGRIGDKPPSLPPVGGTIALRAGPTDDDLKQARLMYDGLSPALKAMPALKPPTGDDQMPMWDTSDNSNTQFATLGLWAAGRHGIPMARALSLLGRRFQISQTPTGGWAYVYQPRAAGGEGPAMTGAGLLGLAVGHGVTADLKGTDVEAAGEDPQVEKGMKRLSGFIGPQSNGLYFMWSVERVGMLYNRQTIGEKEWYPWGADFLLKNQQTDGSWRAGGYPGASPTSDSSFALLFLKRANLAKDLSSKLQFLTQVRKKDG
jgi:hypothetical protein